MTTHDDSKPDVFDRLLRTAFAAEAGKAPSFADPKKADSIPRTIGRYEVLDVLGIGGAGEIYKVFDPELGRNVALKVLRSDRRLDEFAVEAFSREARIAGGLEHPGIVAVHERGTLPDGRDYFTMRLVEGATLADLLCSTPQPEFGRRLMIVEAAARILAHAHERGVVHGDLKPQNIMVGTRGDVQVIDWGFARIEAPSVRSASDRVAGTPAYMAPEQARGEVRAIDPRTDVFALGAILFEVLTGEMLYRANSRADTLRLAARGSHADLSDRISKHRVDPELVELIARCVATQRDDRPSDAAEVANALADHFESTRRRARDADLAAEAARATISHERRTRGLTMVVAAILLVSGGIVTWLAFRSERARADRRVFVVSQTERALEEARHALARARTPESRFRDDSWERAIAATERAVELATTPGAETDQLHSARRLLESAEQERAVSRSARTASEQISDLRRRTFDERQPTGLDAEFDAVYRSRGIKLDAATSDDLPHIAERIRADIVADDLTLGLDSWARARRIANPTDLDAGKRLSELAILADPDPWRRSVRIAIRDGDRDRLLAIANEAANVDHTASSRLLLAKGLLSLVGHDAATAEFERAMLEHPSDHWLAHDYAGIVANRLPTEHDEVVRLYSIALAARPSDHHTMLDLARSHLVAGDSKRAEPWIRKVLLAAPDSGHAHFLMGAIHDAAARHEEAKGAWKRAIELGDGVAGLSLGIQLAREGRICDALDALHIALAALPNDPIVHLELGNRFIDLLDAPRARTHFETAQRLLPASVETTIHWAYARSRLGDTAGAREGLERGWKLATEANQQDIAAVAARFLDEVSRLEGVAAIVNDPKANLVERLGDPQLPTAEIFANVIFLIQLDHPRAAAEVAQALLARVAGAEGFGLRFTAARAAARLALLEGGDIGAPSADERAWWSRRVATWLNADIEELRRGVERGTIDDRGARYSLDCWRFEPFVARAERLALESDAKDPVAMNAAEDWRAMIGAWTQLRSEVD